MRLQSGTLISEFDETPLFYLPIQVKVHEEEKFEDAILVDLNSVRK